MGRSNEGTLSRVGALHSINGKSVVGRPLDAPPHYEGGGQMSRQDCVLSMRDISKRYGEMLALNKVDFDLFAGEVHCLVGENGAGKSTLIKILSGAERPSHGTIEIFGSEYLAIAPYEALKVGIATIYQDVELISSLTVSDNIFLGHETARFAGLVDRRYQNATTRTLLDSLGIHVDENEIVENLSPAQQQMLQIAKALHYDARILIMDEPTGALGMEETKALMTLVKRLASQGIGIIYISHYLDEVFEVGDRITVLKDGLKVGTFAANELDERSLATKMIGRERSSFFERKVVAIGDPILQVRELEAPRLVNNVSFELHRGEILGFGGLVGAGRSELMRVLFGVDQPSSGEVVLRGVPLKAKSPGDAIKAGLGMIPEDRKREGLLMSRSVLENVAIVQNERGGLILDLRKERTLIQDMIDRLRIATSSYLKPVGQLSGGNQQKAIIARWLDSDAEVFIFDEPTKGVDIGAKKQIYDLMVSLVEMGKGIMMVSSDMTELISMSDRIAIIRGNAIVDIVDAKSATEQSLVEAFLGIDSQGGDTNDGRVG